MSEYADVSTECRYVSALLIYHLLLVASLEIEFGHISRAVESYYDVVLCWCSVSLAKNRSICCPRVRADAKFAWLVWFWHNYNG